MKVLQFVIEALAWLQIAASPFVAGLLLGGIVYLAKRDTAGLSIGTGIAFIGLTAGIVWATRVFRRKGAVNFMAKFLGTPELDKKESE